MDDDDMMLGGYGLEEEQERQRHQARLAGFGDDESGGEEPEESDRQKIFMPVATNIVAALGGWEDVEDEETSSIKKVYRPGDSIMGCLRDLKKLWRKDDTDDERSVARVFARIGAIRDLVDIVEEVSERGSWGYKVGLMATDLLAAMTWPIDVAAELKELEDEPPVNTDYSSLLHAQLEYKATILRSGVMLDKLMALLLPCLVKPTGERSEKEDRIVSLILHLIRNLLAIKDQTASTYASADNLEKSSLQSTLIGQLESSHFLSLILTLSSSSLSRDLNPFNVLVLDILHLIFRGVSAAELTKDQRTAANDTLSSLLDQEELLTQASRRHAPSRHSRFGATVSVHAGKTGAKRAVIHHANGVVGNTNDLMDRGKKRGRIFKKARKMDDLASHFTLEPEALIILRAFAKNFLEAAFNTFFQSILKDIRMERPKIRETDNLRALYIATFFIEFFTLSRERAPAETKSEWDFGYIAEFTEIDSIKWVVSRMRIVMDDRPVGWTELQAGIKCFTQCLLLIDTMAASKEEEALEVAEILQNQIYYNGDILDLAHDLVAKFKDQSVAYLDAVVHLAYVLLRMLEKYSKTNAYMYVRKRKAKRARRKKAALGQSLDPQDEDDDDGEADRGTVGYSEHAFAFTSFETRFAHEDILRTLLTYLERFKEFDSPEQLKRIVGLLHRQAVKVKAEGLFFKVSTLELFQRILDNQLALPKDSASKDLLALINFVLRKFFKAVQETPFLLVEAFFPKNRNEWKKFSSWAPEQGESSDDGEGRSKDPKKPKIPGDVQIKDQSLTLTQQLGIAVATLCESGKMGLVTWTIGILKDLAAAREEVILNTDGVIPEDIPVEDETDEQIRARAAGRSQQPSAEALAKFEDYIISYDDEARATAATMDPHLKLMFRLLDFVVESEETQPFQWKIERLIFPDDLASNARILEQFIREPLDLNGEKAVDKLKRKHRVRRRVVRRGPTSDGEGGVLDENDVPNGRPRKRTKTTKTTRIRRPDLPPGVLPSDEDDGFDEDDMRPRRKRKQREEMVYKSAQFIDDSDDDAEADAEFFARERAMIEAQDRAAAEAAAAKVDVPAPKKKVLIRQPIVDSDDDGDGDQYNWGQGEEEEDDEGDVEEASKPPKTRRKPVARTTKRPALVDSDDEVEGGEEEQEIEAAGASEVQSSGSQTGSRSSRSKGDDENEDDEDEDDEFEAPQKPGKRRVVLAWSEDDEEED